MDLINSLTLFVRIVERGGLAAAGRDLGLTPSKVTERVAALEQHYGARLLHRTTRSVSLTDEGRALLDGARQLVSDAQDLKARIKLGTDQLSGLVRVSAPLDLGRKRIAPALNDLMQAHPGISIELVLSDGYVDLAGQGMDIAVRLGELKDSSLKAVRLASNQRVVCAAPSYLAKHAAPKVPSDLLAHNCLLMRFGAGIDHEWSFSLNGKRSSVLVNGNRIANDGSLVRQWCLQGHGIALKSYWDVKEDLASARLIALMPAYATAPSAVHAVYQGGATISKRVRAVIDALAQTFVVKNN